MASERRKTLAAVTGASSGIGAATAAVLAAQGHDLVLGARRMDRLEALRRDVHRSHPDTRVELVELDVTDPEACRAFARAADQAEVLVNNAGLALGREPLAEGHEADWQAMIETNVLGLLRVTRQLLPKMIERRAGTVVMVGSIAGIEAYAGGAVYCATKAGVRSIAKALRHELLGTGVRVCNVEPAAVHTEFSEVRFRGDATQAARVYEGFEPLSAADVAEAIGFLVSRPPHVTVEELVLYPTAQASPTAFHRSTT